MSRVQDHAAVTVARHQRLDLAVAPLDLAQDLLAQRPVAVGIAAGEVETLLHALGEGGEALLRFPLRPIPPLARPAPGREVINLAKAGGDLPLRANPVFRDVHEDSSLSAHLEHALDLYRHIIGQRTDSHRHAGVPAGLLEDLHEEIGGAVDHLGLRHEIGNGIDVSGDAHTADHAVEIPVQRGPEMRHQAQGAQPGRLPPLLDAEFPSELADETPLAVPLRELSGDKDQIPGAHGGDVIRSRLAGLRQLDPELFQTFVDTIGHCDPPGSQNGPILALHTGYTRGGKGGAPLSSGSKLRLRVWVAILAFLPGAIPAGAQEAKAVQPALIYEAEGFADVSGGVKRGATYHSNLNLQLTFDLGRLAGWPDTTVFLSGLG